MKVPRDIGPIRRVGSQSIAGLQGGHRLDVGFEVECQIRQVCFLVPQDSQCPEVLPKRDSGKAESCFKKLLDRVTAQRKRESQLSQND